MKQAALIRRKRWDTLFVLDMCDYAAFEAAMPEAKLTGELLLANGRWHDREIWFGRNFMQFSEAYKDVVYISALPLMWRPNLARFLNCFHQAEASWDKRGKDKNKIAMRDAVRLAKTGKKLFVHLLGGAENLPAISKFIDNCEGIVAITAARAQRSTEVPWLWAVKFIVADFIVEDDRYPADDAERDAIDDAVALATHKAQEYPELRENDERIAATTVQVQTQKANSHRLAA